MIVFYAKKTYAPDLSSLTVVSYLSWRLLRYVYADGRSPMNYIKIRGAAQHNLKNINIDIPRDKLDVITGVSGSGKFSLAFNTIYAEGQRRYVESLSTYARQFI